VALRDTNALVCVECHEKLDHSSLCCVGPYSGLLIELKLGEYQIQQGYFKECVVQVLPQATAERTKTTAYKRVRSNKKKVLKILG
jgi:hypothetical protein